MFQQAKGVFSKQAHVSIPEGLYEEEFGREGFYGPASHLYHRNPPTSWTRIEGPLRPHAFDAGKLNGTQSVQDVLPDRTTMLYNEDVAVQIAKPTGTPDWYFRNADGDEAVFIHEGHGLLETDFGPLSYTVGDYLIIPRGTTYRFCPETAQNLYLIFESRTRIRQPERGLLGHHALYDQTVIETPEPQVIDGQGKEWEVKIKRLNQLTSVFYPFHPLDVMGWKGDLTVWKLNVKNICPVMSHRVHLPPSVHSTFMAEGFIICTFLPRPLESDPEAMRVPFYHRNIEYDEVIFYHSGDFFSRDGIQPGMITLHPQGIHHGPHPKALKASQQKTVTEEVAVMIDAEKPLNITEAALSVEWKDYWASWQEKRPQESVGA